MANQHSKTKASAPATLETQIFPHVAIGPSNAELLKRQAEAERERAANGFPKVEMGADARDKQEDAFTDNDYDPLGLLDPLAQMKRDHQRKGFSLKLLSPSVMNRIGKRGYQFVKDDQGDPVMMGKMVLGEIPDRMAVARRRAPIQRSNEELGAIQDSQREQVAKLRADAKGLGLAVLEAGESVSNHGDGQDYKMGLTVERDTQD